MECDTFGMERWAMNWHHGGGAHAEIDPDRIKLVTKLLDEGRINQLLLSQDVCM